MPLSHVQVAPVGTVNQGQGVRNGPLARARVSEMTLGEHWGPPLPVFLSCYGFPTFSRCDNATIWGVGLKFFEICFQRISSATPTPPQRHPIATPVPPQRHPSATPTTPQCHPGATPVPPQYHTSATPVPVLNGSFVRGMCNFNLKFNGSFVRGMCNNISLVSIF